MPTYYPPNTYGGPGVFNLTNCKFAGTSSSHYCFGIAARPSNNYALLQVYANYCDMPVGDVYSTFVGSWYSYPGNVYFTAYLNNIKRDATLTYQCSGNFPLNNSSTSLATHGTSQYPTGYTPVPTTSPSGRILRVGPTRTYTTVHAAYLAAVHGDDIIIDPGTYNCTEFYGAGTHITKCVRFWGATEDPDDVVLYATNHYYGDHWFFWHLEYFLNIPDNFKAPGMFHLTLDNSQQESWEVPVDLGMDTQNIPADDPTDWWPPVENPFWTEYDDSHEEDKFYE